MPSVCRAAHPVRSESLVPQPYGQRTQLPHLARWAALALCLCCSMVRADDPRSAYLIKLLEGSSQFRVRAEAATSLGKVGDANAIGALHTLDRDVEEPVRVAARESVARLSRIQPVTPRT